MNFDNGLTHYNTWLNVDVELCTSEFTVYDLVCAKFDYVVGFGHAGGFGVDYNVTTGFRRDVGHVLITLVSVDGGLEFGKGR